MPRQPRIQFEDAIYHLTSRGVSRSRIFGDTADYECFIRLMHKVVKGYTWTCHGFCLMTNHFHLIIETPRMNLSEGMQELNGAYACYYNKKYGRVGHLFQNRFHSAIVTKDAHFLELIRYIVLNPVKAGIAESVESWRWSSYSTMTGDGFKYRFVTTDRTLSEFDDCTGGRTAGYREHVAHGLETDPLWKFYTTDLLDEEEVQEVRRPLIDVFENKGFTRDQLIWVAHRIHRYRTRDIAEFLGISHGRVSQILKSSVSLGVN